MNLCNEQIQARIFRQLNASPSGLLPKTLIDRVNADVAVTQAMIDAMIADDQIELSNKRLKITGIGRMAQQNHTKPTTTVENIIDEIKPTQAYQTPDGTIHASEIDAKKHLFKLKNSEKAQRFMTETGISPRIHGIVMNYINAWEQWRQEQAA